MPVASSAKSRTLESQHATKREPRRPRREIEKTFPRPTSERGGARKARRFRSLKLPLLFGGTLFLGVTFVGWRPGALSNPWTGRVGAWAGSLLLEQFGILAFLIPSLLAFWGIRGLRSSSGEQPRPRGFAWGWLGWTALSFGGLHLLDCSGFNGLAPELPRLGGQIGLWIAGPVVWLLGSLGAACAYGLALGWALWRIPVVRHRCEQFFGAVGLNLLKLLLWCVERLDSLGPGLQAAGLRAHGLVQGFPPLVLSGVGSVREHLARSFNAMKQQEEEPQRERAAPSVVPRPAYQPPVVSQRWTDPLSYGANPVPPIVGRGPKSTLIEPPPPPLTTYDEMDDEEEAFVPLPSASASSARMPTSSSKVIPFDLRPSLLEPELSSDEDEDEEDFEEDEEADDDEELPPELPLEVLPAPTPKERPAPQEKLANPPFEPPRRAVPPPAPPPPSAPPARSVAPPAAPPARPQSPPSEPLRKAPVAQLPAQQPPPPRAPSVPEVLVEPVKKVLAEPSKSALKPILVDAQEVEVKTEAVPEVLEEDDEESLEEREEEVLPAYAPAGQTYILPDLDLLDEQVVEDHQVLEDELRENSQLLLSKLSDFGVQGAISCIRPGPVITRYEFEPAPGIKINKIVNLADDLALALKAVASPRVAMIPKSSALGIELPNHNRETVHFKSIVDSETYQQHPSLLKLALGADIAGNPYVADLARMPHLLIAGSTGSGKSVCINTLLLSLLMNATPEQLQLILVDPKMLELSMYNDVPHLIEDVVTDPKKAATALNWAVREMENRYKKLSRRKVRNISQYNEVVERQPMAEPTARDPNPVVEQPLPYIVIIIDELADLMMVAGNDVETAITRLAQMARAAGIHLVLATQRPSVDVITGSIKANFPCRISFKVASKVDSRTVLDGNGAEKLLGKGDMFFIAPSSSSLTRIHGCFLGEEDIQRVVDHWKPQPKLARTGCASIFEPEIQDGEEESFSGRDELYDQAVRFIVSSGHASISLLQRRLRVGHARAARLIDMMEQDGVVGPFEGSKTREVLWKPEQLPENAGLSQSRMGSP